MSETKKTVRRFILTVVWTLFVTLTLSGLIIAGERTTFVSTGQEPSTVNFEFF